MKRHRFARLLQLQTTSVLCSTNQPSSYIHHQSSSSSCSSSHDKAINFIQIAMSRMLKDGLPEMRTVTGLHRFTLEKFSLCRGVGWDQAIYSNSFTVGGRQWAITVFPDRTKSPLVKDDPFVAVGFRVTLLSQTHEQVHCLCKITVLDQSGRGNHKTFSLFEDGEGPLVISTGEHYGFSPQYARDDCLKIECQISVFLTEITTESYPSIVVDDDGGVNFLPLLETGEGSDVVFYVMGMLFRAHKVILSARSSVFDSMLSNLASKESEKVIVMGIEPQVFKALLHFIYSDTLPEDERSLMGGYAFGPSVSNAFGGKLLAAAHEYGLSRLKTICEAYLWRSMSFARFAETFALAEKYKATKLKNLCLQYAARNYDALMELDSFAYLVKKHPQLLKEVDGYL